MRIAILSDIHGNLPALEAVLADSGRLYPDLYLVAGDLSSRAPFPLETLRALQSLGDRAVMIAGNADLYQTGYASGSGANGLEHGPGGGLIRWTHRALGEEGLSFLARLGVEDVVSLPGLPSIRMVHGSPGRVSQGIVPEKDEQARAVFRMAGVLGDGYEPPPLAGLVAGAREEVVVCGHTHVAWHERTNQGRTLVVNPGAVGFPINGDTRAQYALMTWTPRAGWNVEHRAAGYSLERLEQAYHDSGLLEEGGLFARAMLANARAGQNVPGFFTRHVIEVGYQRAAASFPWDAYER